jgi:hypothetical protein
MDLGGRIFVRNVMCFRKREHFNFVIEPKGNGESYILFLKPGGGGGCIIWQVLSFPSIMLVPSLHVLNLLYVSSLQIVATIQLNQFHC